MRGWTVAIGCVLAAAPAAAHGPRTAAAPSDAPVTVTTPAAPSMFEGRSLAHSTCPPQETYSGR